MKSKLVSIVTALHPRRVSALASYLLKDEAISGKLIIVAVACALLAANSGFQLSYEQFWHTYFRIGLGSWNLSLDLRHWVNDVLMAIFFLVVGLELKRELLMGELRQFRAAILPIAAAIGGMIVPALIYMVINAGEASFRGWAIPMATDIAIAIGILALLGSRIPSSIRLFLLTLAIVDDIVAVIVIAIFYSHGVSLLALGLVAITAIVMFVLQRMGRLPFAVFCVIAVVLWLLVYNSGVHPSITGALIGLLAPVTVSANNKRPIAERLEKLAIPISTLVVVPLFAFANAGIVLSPATLQGSVTTPLAAGVIFGLALGKVLGIAGVSWLMIRFGASELPSNSHWGHIIGAGLLAGIGFTVSIFVTDLAFDQPELTAISKISILVASAISGLVGMAVLRFMPKESA